MNLLEADMALTCVCVVAALLTITEVTTHRITFDANHLIETREIDGFKGFKRGRSHFYTDVGGYKSRLDFQELKRRKRDTHNENEAVVLHIETDDDHVIELDLRRARQLLECESNVVFRQRDYVRTSHSEIPDCFYTGHVTADPDSSTASVALCDQLEGVFTDQGTTYWFESVNKTENLHDIVIGKREDPIKFDDFVRQSNSNVKDIQDHIKDKHDDVSDRVSKADHSIGKRQVTTLTVESAIFVDEAYVNKLKALGFTTDTEFTNQLLVRLHGMQAEWSKSSVLGYNVVFAIKLIEFWQTDPSWYTASTNLQSTLSSVCSGAQSQGTYASYDHIHLFTGVDGTDVAGKAYTGNVCDEGYKCAVSTYTRATEFTIPAHEFGHSMNMSHDADEGCPAPNDGIMGSKPTGWSACSVASMAILLSGSTANCLTSTDVSTATLASLQSLWPGMIYTDDEICEYKNGPGYRFRYYPAALGECSLHACIQMDTSASNYGTMEDDAWPTDGRYCDTGKVCWTQLLNNAYQCIAWAETGLDTSLITAVAGGWSEWGTQTSCSRTCGTGVQYRQRFCNNPKPQNSATCTGDEYELTLCNTDACSGDSSTESTLIDQRAGETCASLVSNGFISSSNYQSTGTKLNNYNAMGRCEVKCNTQSGFTMPTFQRFGLMPDGTPCSPDTQTFEERYNLPSTDGGSSHCVQGTCIKTGCDGIPGRIRDRCGVCGGTNSTCSIVDGVYTTAINGDVKILELPIGAYNIFFYFDYSISSMQYYFLEVWDGPSTYIVSYAFLDTTDTTSNPTSHAGTSWYFNADAQFLYALGPITQTVDIYVTDFTGGTNTGITYGYSTAPSSGTTTTASGATATTSSGSTATTASGSTATAASGSTTTTTAPGGAATTTASGTTTVTGESAAGTPTSCLMLVILLTMTVTCLKF